MTSRSAKPRPNRIGILAAEPIRVAGLATIFDLPAQPDQAQLVPVIGSLEELLGSSSIEYVVVDLHSTPGNLELLETVRNARPDIRLIVIGPEGDDEMVLKAITAGARAYLGLSAGPDLVRQAVEVVTSGSIWAPRPLLSRLIDRLLHGPSAHPCHSPPTTDAARRAGTEADHDGAIHARNCPPAGHRATNRKVVCCQAYAQNRRGQPRQAFGFGNEPLSSGGGKRQACARFSVRQGVNQVVR